MAYQLSGVFSGIDTEVLIAHTIGANSGTLYRLTDQKYQLQAEKAAISTYESRLGDLKSLMDSLRDSSKLRNVTASTSDSNVGYVATSAGMGEGIYNIEVNRLASAEKEVHAGIDPTETWIHNVTVSGADDEYISADNISDSFGENYMFTFKFGQEDTISVDLSAYDQTGITLNQLATEINMAAGYQAATATQNGDDWTLQLSAASSGSDKGLTITDSNSVAMLDGTDDLTQKVNGDVGGDALVGEGQFVYTYNGETRTITTGQWTSLDDLIDSINNDSENPGVIASVLEYDGATGGDFHLVLTGRDSGADYAVSIDAGTTLAAFGAGEDNWTETQTASNSQFRVDGYPDGEWIERNGNNVSNVIPGGTLYLTGEGDTTITLSRSTTQLKEHMNNLVAVFNGLRMKLDEYTGYDEENQTSGALQGDYFLNGIFNQLRSALTQTAGGFVDGSETFTLAAQIGLEVDRYGEFTFDEAVFNEAIEEDYDAVLALIGAVAGGTTSSSDIQFTSATEATQGGIYDIQVDYDANGDISSARIKLENESGYRDLTVSDNTLMGVYGNPEQYMSLTVAQGGTSETRSYQVRIREGFAGEIYDRVESMLDEADGAMVTRLNSYTNSTGTGLVDLVEEKIDRQELRLEQMEQRLIEKYARLEQTLAILDSQRGAFDALFSSIDANNSSDE